MREEPESMEKGRRARKGTRSQGGSGCEPPRPRDMNANWLAKRVVRLYPRTWRARYEEELLALLEQGHVRWRDALDLARGATWEWVQTSESYRVATSVAWAVASWIVTSSVVDTWTRCEVADAPLGLRS
jgi:hypothetical protein